MSELRPLSPDEVAKHAGVLVELPPFPDGTPFVARVRPSGIRRLLYVGKLPNPLLQKYLQSSPDRENVATAGESSPTELIDIMNALCADILVEPRWEDVKEYLTEQQIDAILTYGQVNLGELMSFRGEPRVDTPPGGDGQGVGNKAQPAHRAKK